MLSRRGHQALSVLFVVSTGACFRASTLTRLFTRSRNAFSEDMSSNVGWNDLHVSKDELSLDLTLNMGQCFNWKKIEHASDMCWVGILGTEPLVVKQTHATTEFINLRQPSNLLDDNLNQFMRQYFQLDHNLDDLYGEWGQGCERMKVVTQCLKGARVVRQDPWECLISFICSSNNNIPRIIQMLEKLRRRYGRFVCSVQAIKVSEVHLGHSIDLPLPQWSPPGLSMDECIQEQYKWVVNYDVPNLTSTESTSSDRSLSYDLYEFPTVAALAEASEDDLRALGMGYRAKYIINSAKLVRSKCAALSTNIVDGVKNEKAEPSVVDLDNGAMWFEHLRHLAREARCHSTSTSTIKTEDSFLPLIKIKQEHDAVVKLEPGSANVHEDLAMSQRIDAARMQVQALLLELPGVGRKVADCVALFSLDQTSAVPVDTHVWNIAIRDYAPQLRRATLKGELNDATFEQRVKSEHTEINATTDMDTRTTTTPTKKKSNSKRGRTSNVTVDSTDTTPHAATPISSLHTPHGQVTLQLTQNTPAEVDSIETRSLTPAVYEAVGAEFRRRFGNHAGWAHSVLFAAELGVFKDRLPMGMQNEMKVFADLQRSAKKVKREEKLESKKNALLSS